VAEDASSLGEVIRRLPPGVDYTAVKQILWSLPPPLTVLGWAAAAQGDPTFKPFRGWTYRAIDRELQRREEALKDTAPSDNRERTLLVGLRAELVKQLTSELATPGNRKKIDRRLRLDGIPVVSLRVWIPTRRGPKFLDERLVASEPREMGKTTVTWFDPERVNQAWMELFRKHFPELMSRRSGHRWRTNRPLVGWPLIAQHVVPALYDYLKPFYPRARLYHHFLGKILTAGRYQMQLLRDITDILRCELPFAGELTVQRVKAAVQRHVKERPRKAHSPKEKAST
jgi:hypothetical protein